MDIKFDKPEHNLKPSWVGLTPNVASGLTRDILGTMNSETQEVAFTETMNQVKKGNHHPKNFIDTQITKQTDRGNNNSMMPFTSSTNLIKDSSIE